MIKRFLAVAITVLMAIGMLTGFTYADSGSELNLVKKGKLIMSTSAAFPPYEMTDDNGNYIGIDVEIAQAIADKLGLELVIDDMEFPAALEAVQNGKSDMVMAGVTVDDTRKKVMDFSNSYATAVQVVIVPTDSDIKTIDDLAGKQIGTQMGTTGYIYCLDDFGDGNVIPYENGITAVQALLNDQIDCIVIDNAPAQSFIKANAGLKILDTEYAVEEYAIGFNKGNTALKEAVNGALAELTADGTIQKIIDKYINAAADPQDNENLPFWEDFCAKFYQAFIEADRWQQYLEGVGSTLMVTALSLIIGVILGIFVAIIRTAHDQQRPGRKSPILGIFNGICQVYVTIIRGTPMLVQLLIMGFVIFSTSREYTAIGILTLGINSGAYVAEIIRGGLMSLDPGQMEAGRSLGLNYIDTMRFVVIPQAFKAILPSLGNEFITLLKDTALIYTIGGKELVYAAKAISTRTYEQMFPLVGTAVIYLALVLIFTWLQSLLERRLRQSDRR